MFGDVGRFIASMLPGARGRLRREGHRLLRAAIARANGKNCNIVVVCQGNICRSPLAAALLKRKLDGRGETWRVESYGNLLLSGAESPANAIEAADLLGVDLRPHRSQHFSRAAATGANVVVVFDDINRRAITD